MVRLQATKISPVIIAGISLLLAGCPALTGKKSSSTTEKKRKTGITAGTGAPAPVFSPVAAVPGSARLNGPVHALVKLSDGTILAAGEFTTPPFLAKLTADGEIDAEFAAHYGAGANAPIRAIAVEVSGRILIGGEFTDVGGTPAGHIARLGADGTVDAEFVRATGRGFNDRVSALAVLPDSKIIAGGNFTSFNGQTATRVARLMPDGTADAAFGVALAANAAPPGADEATPTRVETTAAETAPIPVATTPIAAEEPAPTATTPIAAEEPAPTATTPIAAEEPAPTATTPIAAEPAPMATAEPVAEPAKPTKQEKEASAKAEREAKQAEKAAKAEATKKAKEAEKADAAEAEKASKKSNK